MVTFSFILDMIELFFMNFCEVKWDNHSFLMHKKNLESASHWSIVNGVNKSQAVDVLGKT